MKHLFALLLAALAVGVAASTVSAHGTAAAKLPHRIISLSPTATETLFAIGAGKQVIAVDDQSNFPATAPKTTLSGYRPNAEAIAGYRPDLVVAYYDPNGLAGTLRKLGIRVLVQDAPKNLDGAWRLSTHGS